MDTDYVGELADEPIGQDKPGIYAALTTQMTAATPIMMPSAVSALRPLVAGERAQRFGAKESSPQPHLDRRPLSVAENRCFTGDQEAR
jgi:hypothetical protein